MSILDKFTPQSFVPYLATGVGVFAANGDPNGVQVGGIGSLYCDLATGNYYSKTTMFDTLTGWVLLGGGGGSGTVTSVGLTGNSMFTITGSPVTTSGNINLDFTAQSGRKFLASPSDGSSAIPAFRTIANGDISASVAALLAVADPPPNAIQFNNGSNILQGEPELTYDALTGTLLLGVSGGFSGQFDFRNTNGATIRFKTNNPVNQTITLFDALPTTGQAVVASSVSGSNVTWGYSTIASGATINPTDNVMPVRINSSAFGDSKISLATNSTVVTASDAAAFVVGANGNTNPVFRIVSNVASQAAGVSLTGNAAGSGVVFTTLSTGTNENLDLQAKGNTGAVRITNVSGTTATIFRVLNVQGGAASLLMGGNDSNGVVIVGTSNTGSNTAGGIVAASGKGVILTSALGYGINASGNIDANSTPDTRWVRSAASVWRASDGSSGSSSLLIAGSAISLQAQLHIEAATTGTKAIYANSPGSTTVNLLQIQEGNSDRFAVAPNGKCTFSQNRATSATASVVGRLDTNVTDANNSGTGATNLYTYTIAANTLGTNLDRLSARMALITAANANNKTIDVVLGTTTIATTGALAFNNAAIEIFIDIIRVSSTAQRCIVTINTNSALLPDTVTFTAATEDLTTNLVLKTVGTGGATNDITNKMGMVDVHPA